MLYSFLSYRPSFSGLYISQNAIFNLPAEYTRISNAYERNPLNSTSDTRLIFQGFVFLSDDALRKNHLRTGTRQWFKN